MKLLELFRSGMDTLAVAEHLGGIASGWTEASVYNRLAKERNEETVQNDYCAPVGITFPIRYVGFDRTQRPWGGR